MIIFWSFIVFVVLIIVLGLWAYIDDSKKADEYYLSSREPHDDGI